MVMPLKPMMDKPIRCSFKSLVTFLCFLKTIKNKKDVIKNLRKAKVKGGIYSIPTFEIGKPIPHANVVKNNKNKTLKSFIIPLVINAKRKIYFTNNL